MLHSRTQVKSSYFTPKPLLLPTQLHDLTCCITPQTKRKNKENRSVPTAAVEEPKGVHDANASHWPLDLMASPHLHSHWRSTNCPRADGHRHGRAVLAVVG